MKAMWNVILTDRYRMSGEVKSYNVVAKSAVDAVQRAKRINLKKFKSGETDMRARCAIKVELTAVEDY
jgi:hypothetical protein